MPKAATSKKKPSSRSNNSQINARPLDINKREIKRKLPNVWKLTGDSLRLIWQYRRLIIGIVLVFGLVNFVVAKGFSSGVSASSLKSQLSGFFHGKYSSISSSLTVFAFMLTSSGTSSSSSGGGTGYELALVIIASLALIWAIRNSLNGNTVRIRDAYYRGMYPLIPFVLVLLLISLEFLPMIGGLTLYAAAVYNNIAVNGLEVALFGVIALLLTCLTMFWLSSSVFAMYIVTLPEMTPLKALRSAKKLVKGRRFSVLLRLLYLPLAITVIMLALMLPAIIFIAPAAQWLFMVLGLLIIAVFHSYLYNLYREMLENE